MRIGIVGAAGTGKTTLAKALARHLGVSLVPDFVPIVLREHGKESWKEVHDWRTSRILRLSSLERKIAAETGNAAFVSDRTAIDYLAYWLYNQSEHETPEQNAAFLQIVRDHVRRYDRCVCLPWREKIEEGTHRSANPMHNLKIAALKRGLLTSLGVAVADAPYTFGEDLTAWVERHLVSSPAVAILATPEPLPAPPPPPPQQPAAAAPALAPAPSPPPAPTPAAAPEIDEAALVRRIVEQACRALQERQEPLATQAPDDGVWKLDRRVEKLAKALSETEDRLREMIAAKMVDTGVPSVFRGVQGLQADAPGYAKKKALLADIMSQNVALRERIVERRGAPVATRATVAPAAPALVAAEASAVALVDSAEINFEEKAF